MVEIERARALRLAKEQADEALESAQRSSLLLRKHELHTTVEQSAQLAEASVRQAESKLMETVGLIQEESKKLLEAERVHTLRQNKARMAARQAQVGFESWCNRFPKGLCLTQYSHQLPTFILLPPCISFFLHLNFMISFARNMPSGQAHNCKVF